MKNIKSILATILGLLGSIATALVVIDLDTFDLSKPKDKLKLFIVIMPAICGYFTQLKGNDKNV